MSNTKKWTTANIPTQAGRRAVITGANSGIGFHTALELARAGAEVVVPARTQAKTQDAVTRILREVPRASVQPGILDLADLASVRRFAATQADKPLDLLINNAGVMALPHREITVDGFERQFGTNYLGPFALTALLLPALLRTPGSRLVTVASTAANTGKIQFDNLQSERKYVPMWGTYCQAKLADLMFSLEIQRRAHAAGLPLLCTAAHPGYAITNLQGEHLPTVMKLATKVLAPLLSHDAAHGALPTLRAAVDPAAQPASYYGPDGPMELKGDPTLAKIPARARDTAVAKQLWQVSEQLTGVSFGVLSHPY
jgi:NAD(P)-dependent dehydrogenase (short-subunit alcohol dehydrogenase family)